MAYFRPRLLDELRGYDRAKLAADVSAGLTVAAVALPLAIAFAIASGLKPEAGVFTPLVAGVLISAPGGARVPNARAAGGVLGVGASPLRGPYGGEHPPPTHPRP